MNKEKLNGLTSEIKFAYKIKSDLIFSTKEINNPNFTGKVDYLVFYFNGNSEQPWNGKFVFNKNGNSFNPTMNFDDAEIVLKGDFNNGQFIGSSEFFDHLASGYIEMKKMNQNYDINYSLVYTEFTITGKYSGEIINLD